MGAYVVVDPDGSNPVRLTGASVTTEAPVWSPDGTRLLGYAYDPAVGSNEAMAVFDVSGRSPPITIPEDGLSNAALARHERRLLAAPGPLSRSCPGLAGECASMPRLEAALPARILPRPHELGRFPKRARPTG